MNVGRANQKQRTRTALVDAARSLAANGRPLTIVDVAEAAQVSSATAYRYFSNPQDLLLETVIAPVPEILSDLPDQPADRIDELVRRLAEHQLGDESLWRAVLQASLERWSQQVQLGPESQVPTRGRHRLEMTEHALAPLADRLSPDLHRRLVMATMLVCGMEALVAARDACGLEPDEAKDVMRWAAQALLHAAVAEAD